jgi:hypothetical protein
MRTNILPGIGRAWKPAELLHPDTRRSKRRSRRYVRVQEFVVRIVNDE